MELRKGEFKLPCLRDRVDQSDILEMLPEASLWLEITLHHLAPLRFHDLRHDFATRVQRASGNIKVTQRALNHAEVRSSLRYLYVDDNDVAEALEAAQSPRTTTPRAKKEAG